MVILGEQMALDGLAPRRRKSSAHVKVPAVRLPVAQVVIDVQAARQTFRQRCTGDERARAFRRPPCQRHYLGPRGIQQHAPQLIEIH